MDTFMSSRYIMSKHPKNLVIVESPAKSQTIKKILWDDFEVKASFGHVADLAKKNMGIDIKNNFTPSYILSPDKKKVVKELKDYAKKVDTVWIATDEDREGEAIGWHVAQALGLDITKTPRIVFHEITKDAITKAVKEPRLLNTDLVNAQQARRLLDRLVWFELSPILWQKIKTWLSAWRVQSVAVRLIAEKEREIQAFESKSSYKIEALLEHKAWPIKATTAKSFPTQEKANSFLQECSTAVLSIADTQTKPGKKSSTAPFTTSTLQQEASRKLWFSVSKTMQVAQKLYEAGAITYMRTDSTNIATSAVADACKVIESSYGKEYVQAQTYAAKKKWAQEAHECIRPTAFGNNAAGKNADEKKLYQLIRQRAIASQMTDAQLEKTTITIDVSTSKTNLIAQWEVIVFDWFLKVYSEWQDDDGENGDDETALLPKVSVWDLLQYTAITATEKFGRHSARYTEASLVKKLEAEWIGRPSTYAPTIATIQKRWYVVRQSIAGEPKPYTILTLKKWDIQQTEKTVQYGADKNKLFPTDIGFVVNDFLLEHFPKIMDYQFTAQVEEEFDTIAQWKREWTKMLKDFYEPFHALVEKTSESADRASGERILWTDPKSGKQVLARIGRYGPLVQIGDGEWDEKPKFAPLKWEKTIETITLEEALKMFNLPRTIGQYEGKDMVIGIGRFGPYVKWNNSFASISKDFDPYTIEFDAAKEILETKLEADKKRTINEWKDSEHHIILLRGRYGAYAKIDGKNIRLPKEFDAEKATKKDCLALITPKTKETKKPTAKKKVTKKVASKKTTTKKTDKKSVSKK